jgi:N-acetylneuraminic acid mutarotase
LRNVGYTPETHKFSQRIFVFGGGLHEKTPVDDQNVYCLDLDSLLWVIVCSKSLNSPCKRLGHSLTSIGTNLFLFGGMDNNNTFNDLFIFNTITNSWSEPETTGTKPSKRCGHSATLIKNKIYIFGGADLNLNPPETMNDMYCLNIDLMEWTKVLIYDSKCRLNLAMIDYIVDDKDGLLLFGGLDFDGVYNDLVLLELLK